MIAVRMQRDAAVDEVNRVIVGLDGDDRRTLVYAIELVLTRGLEVPTISRLVEIERRDPAST